MDFDEIRPYNNDELPHIFEELIADPAFRQVTAAAMPEVLSAMDICIRLLMKRRMVLRLTVLLCRTGVWRTPTSPIIGTLFWIRDSCR